MVRSGRTKFWPATKANRTMIWKKFPFSSSRKILLFLCDVLKFIYFEKATIFCEISTVDLHYEVTVTSMWRFRNILWPSQNIWTLPGMLEAGCRWHTPLLFLSDSKGQLISKCLFGVLQFFQKMNKNNSTLGIINQVSR